jgi:UDPglucose 6-dehydrogenase
MGLAFKENTPAISDSPAIELIKNLLSKNVSVVSYDPLAIDAAKVIFNGEIEFVDSPEALLSMCGLCVITYRSGEFKKKVENYKPQRSIKLFDCWRQLERTRLDKNYRYFALGRGQEIE